MPPANFPLRWETTGDQWWYVSPIDWAAANGHYDLVRELLHLDSNLLIKLTSLRRIRRLETVWDDDQTQFSDVAKCRSEVALKLLLECESKKGHNSLIRAGYGGWLLYTAASAGDVGFVKQLLERDPLLVFGEGEYGITDMFYAAARSKNSEVFRLLLDSSMAQKGSGGEIEAGNVEMSSVFRWEMKNRAVHASARGGNLEILKELIRDCDDVLVYRDVHGSTILHSACGRGQVEVVKDLIATFDIITATDNQGNTALNVAAYRGYLPVVEILIHTSPSSTTLTNNFGDTFLHMAVAGFRSPGFRRLDHQMELMKQLVRGRIFDAAEIINVRNSDGRTPLHMAIIANVNSDLVELLMTVPLINLNIRDHDGMTPLDLLKHRPQSPSSEILIKRLATAGGISNCHDRVARNALVLHLKLQAIGGSSPGTTFGVSDAEIFLYTGNENTFDVDFEPDTPEYASCSSELSQMDSFTEPNLSENRKSLLKSLFQDRRRKLENIPTSLRQRFSELSNNKKMVSSSDFPSPSTKKRFATGLMHGVIRALPIQSSSPSSFLSRSPLSSPRSRASPMGGSGQNDNAGTSSLKQFFNGARPKLNHNQSSFSKKAMNQYFCFGAQGLAVDDSRSCAQSNERFKHVLGVGVADENR